MTVGLLPPAPETRVNIRHRHHATVWRAAVRHGMVPGKTPSRPRDPARRARCEWSFRAFLLEYMAHKVWDFSSGHEDIIQAIQDAALFRGRMPFHQAVAAPRSYGKTTLFECGMLWVGLYRHRRFGVIICATDKNSSRRMDAIQGEILENPRLAEDFPEIVDAVKAFGGNPRSAPPDYPWSTSSFRLANGFYCESRSADSSIAGMNYRNMRPDWIMLDDVEQLKTARSAKLMEELEERINLEILDLHDVNFPAAYFWVCTVRKPGCVSARYTDPNSEPAWRGKRFKALLKDPEREDLWERFTVLCHLPLPDVATDWAPITDVCKLLGLSESEVGKLEAGYVAALRFYLAHREDMDRGVELLDADRLPVYYLMYIKAKNEERFYCEYQNDPPADPNKQELQLDDAHLVMRRIDGLPERVVPTWADVVIVTIDLGLYKHHWEATAWSLSTDANALIAQGIEETGVNAKGQYEMADTAGKRTLVVDAVVRAIERVRADHVEPGFLKAGTAEILRPFVGIDAGGAAQEVAWYRAVVEFAHRAGPRWLAMAGRDWNDGMLKKAEGRNFVESEDLGAWLYFADPYKHDLVASYQRELFADNGMPAAGTRLLHAKTPKVYLRHQTAEFYQAEHVPTARVGKDVRQGWHKKSGRANHWFDTAAMNYVLRDILRAHLQGRRPAPPPASKPAPRERNDWIADVGPMAGDDWISDGR